MTDREDFLAHYGVKGMRWGKRKQHSEYTDNQVKRDVQVYGKRGARRINKQLHDGSSISVARGDEKTRRDGVMSKDKYVRQGGKLAGATVGVVGANVAISAARKAAYSGSVRSILDKTFGSGASAGAMALADIAANPIVRVTASAGAAKVGTMLAGDIAVNTRLRAHGYNPNRK